MDMAEQQYAAQLVRYEELCAKYQQISQQYAKSKEDKIQADSLHRESREQLSETKKNFAEKERELRDNIVTVEVSIQEEEEAIIEEEEKLENLKTSLIFAEVNLEIMQQVENEEIKRKEEVAKLKKQYDAFIATIHEEHKKEVEKCLNMQNILENINNGIKSLSKKINNLEKRESHNPMILSQVPQYHQLHSSLMQKYQSIPNIANLKYVSAEVLEILKLSARKTLSDLEELSTEVHSIVPLLNEKCPICDNYIPLDNMHFFHCKHGCCRKCAITMVTKALEAKAVPANCPTAEHKVTPEDVQALLQGEDYDKYDQMYTAHLLPASVACPQPNCTGEFNGNLADLNGATEDDKRVLCRQCQKFFCPFCQVPYHFGQTCKNYQDWAEQNKNADTLTAAAIQNELNSGAMKKCPTCALLSTKPTGCNYVVCPACRIPWCFQTGKLRSVCGGGHGCH